MFRFAGLVGMGIESKCVRRWLAASSPAALPNSGRSQEIVAEPPSYIASFNPFPALSIDITGLAMATHFLKYVFRSQFYMLWRNLLARFAIMRSLMYFFLWLRPPRNILPSRPPTETLAAFFLACGGLCFQFSTEEATIAAMCKRHDAVMMFLWPRRQTRLDTSITSSSGSVYRMLHLVLLELYVDAYVSWVFVPRASASASSSPPSSPSSQERACDLLESFVCAFVLDATAAMFLARTPHIRILYIDADTSPSPATSSSTVVSAPTLRKTTRLPLAAFVHPASYTGSGRRSGKTRSKSKGGSACEAIVPDEDRRDDAIQRGQHVGTKRPQESLHGDVELPPSSLCHRLKLALRLTIIVPDLFATSRRNTPPVIINMPNQHKPAVPPEVIESTVRSCWVQGMPNTKILKYLKQGNFFDQETYGIGLTTLKSYMKNIWHLQGTIKQGHTLESIHEPIQIIRIRFPQSALESFSIIYYLRLTEPQAVLIRRGKGFVRKRFYAAGVNHIWAFDQHDKWKRFGLFFHLGTEPYSSYLLWIRVWWTNSNPRFVMSLYSNTIREVGGIPLLTQSDLGSENFGIANAQTSIRQYLEPALAGTLQHKWMGKHNNVRPEISWKQFRLRWTPGFEALFDLGLDNGWYDPTNTLQLLIFRWLAIPFVQAELDAYRFRHNNSKKRANRHTFLPQGIPENIFRNSASVRAQDFKIPVPESVLAAAEDEWAPADHPVFQLVPPNIEVLFNTIYDRLGRPVVDFMSFWNIYLAMHAQALEELDDLQDIQHVLQAIHDAPDAGENQGIPLMAYERHAQFGVDGIPAAQVVEDRFDYGQQNEEDENDTDFGDVWAHEEFVDVSETIEGTMSPLMTVESLDLEDHQDDSTQAGQTVAPELEVTDFDI
ncbi:hypothetical protein EIP86_009443 [Pleurotus ostreatoroseus]|nr:hypothetical protein EIP86_009443 [Pleurotus ostreatoroseus]